MAGKKNTGGTVGAVIGFFIGGPVGALIGYFIGRKAGESGAHPAIDDGSMDDTSGDGGAGLLGMAIAAAPLIAAVAASNQAANGPREPTQAENVAASVGIRLDV